MMDEDFFVYKIGCVKTHLGVGHGVICWVDLN
jgi:hypothetical protein